MPPIVNALTGFARGMVRIRRPSDMTMCLPSQTTGARPPQRLHRGPAMHPRSSRHLDRDLDFAHPGVFEQRLNDREVVADRLGEVGECLLLRGPLRPATGQPRNRHADPPSLRWSAIRYFIRSVHDAVRRAVQRTQLSCRRPRRRSVAVHRSVAYAARPRFSLMMRGWRAAIRRRASAGPSG